MPTVRSLRDCNFLNTIVGVTSIQDKEGRRSLDVVIFGTVLGSSSTKHTREEAIEGISFVVYTVRMTIDFFHTTNVSMSFNLAFNFTLGFHLTLLAMTFLRSKFLQRLSVKQ